MKALLAALVLAAAAITPATAWADEASTAPAAEERPESRAADAPKDLVDTIDKAIALLEAGKIRETVELLAPAKQIADRGIDKLVERFEPRAKDLLMLLKKAKDQKPTLEGDNRAAYPRTEGMPPVTFIKLDGRWYLK